MSRHRELVLNQFYSKELYPTQAEKEEMANILGTKYAAVIDWFKEHNRDKIRTNSPSSLTPLGKEIKLNHGCV